MTDDKEQERPDLRGPAIVISGSVLSGFKFYGPFTTVDAAYEWCANKTLCGSLSIDFGTIAILEQPRTDHVLV